MIHLFFCFFVSLHYFNFIEYQVNINPSVDSSYSKYLYHEPRPKYKHNTIRDSADKIVVVDYRDSEPR